MVDEQIFMIVVRMGWSQPKILVVSQPDIVVDGFYHYVNGRIFWIVLMDETLLYWGGCYVLCVSEWW